MTKLLLHALALAALAAASGPARAQCDGCVAESIGRAAADTIDAAKDLKKDITKKLDQMTDGIIEALSRSVAATSAQAAKSAELVAEGAQRSQTAMEQMRQETRYEIPDACAVLASTRVGVQDASRSAPAIGGGVGRGGGGGGRAPSGGVTPLMQEALDISAGRVAAPTPGVQAGKAAAGACGTFTNGGTLRGKTCDQAGFAPAVSNGHPDADIRAETLFDGPQRGLTAGEFRRKLTVDPDGPEKQALEAFLRNMNTPIDLEQLKKAELQTNAGRQYLAFRDAYEARMSLVEKPSRALAASRMANATLIPTVQQLLTSDVTGAFTKAYLTKNYPQWEKKGISVDELNNLEAERRFMNRDWHLKMASLSPEGHVREQTTMLAFRNMMLARVAEKLDTIAVTSGLSMGTQVRQEMVPQLITLHGAASK